MQTMHDPLRAARVAIRTGRFRDAAAALAELPSDTRQAPEWFLLSAMASWRLGDFPTSRQQALEARARFRAMGDADGEMRAVNVAAAGAFGLGTLSEAEDGFARALQLAKQQGDDLMVARCANNLGNIALYLGQHEAALGFYRRARTGFTQLGFEHGVAETWINTAITYRDRVRYEDALRAADRALDAAERSGSARLIAEAQANRGAAMAGLGDPELGRVHLERSLTIARSERDRLAEADVLRLLGTAALAVGARAEAVRRGEESVAVARETHHPWSIAESQRDLARTYRAVGRAADAASAFAVAEAAYRSLGATVRGDTVHQEASDS
jgi:tetratricopeptide (TPR) repeat protein